MGFETAPSKELYHSSRLPWDSTEIDPSVSDLGFHVGTLEQADKRARVFGGGERYEDGSNIMPLMKSKYSYMLGLNDEGSFHADAIAKQLAKKKIISKDEAKRIEQSVGSDWSGRKAEDDKLRAALLRKGYDGIKYSNTQEGRGTSYAFIDPTNIRSRFAAFDPMRRDSSDIMAGVAPMGLFPWMYGEEQK
jgi:hypothetical protein